MFSCIFNILAFSLTSGESLPCYTCIAGHLWYMFTFTFWLRFASALFVQIAKTQPVPTEHIRRFRSRLYQRISLGSIENRPQFDAICLLLHSRLWVSFTPRDKQAGFLREVEERCVVDKLRSAVGSFAPPTFPPVDAQVHGLSTSAQVDLSEFHEHSNFENHHVSNRGARVFCLVICSSKENISWDFIRDFDFD